MIELLLTLALAAGPRPTIEKCRKQAPKGFRQVHFCLAETANPKAIAEIHRGALAWLEKHHGGRPLERASELFDAAENAGRVAAMTKEASLYATVDAEEAASRAFGVHGIGHMLSLLRMGYGRGGEADAKRLETVHQPAAARCKSRLGDSEPVVAAHALRCLGEAREAAYARDIVATMVASDQAVVHDAGVIALRALEGRSRVAREFRPLTTLLRAPLPERWTSGQVMLRYELCGLLRGVLEEGETWARDAALAAVAEIGDKHSQARDACQSLAEASGAETPTARVEDASEEDSERAWPHPLERCRTLGGAVMHLMFCARSLPAEDGGRSYELRLTDVRSLDPKTKEHKVVGRYAVPTRATETMLYEQVSFWELTAQRFLVFAPVVTGSAKRFDEGRTTFLVLDPAGPTFEVGWESTPCPSGCSRQEIELRYKPAEPSRTIFYWQTVNGRRTSQTLIWDGARLLPPD